MAATTNVQVIITAQDGATAVINGIGKSFTSASNDMASGAQQSSAAVKLLTFQLAQLALKQQLVAEGAKIVAGGGLVIGAALVAGSIASIKMAADFQESMTLIQTQAGASAAEVDKMGKAILGLAGQVGFAPKQLADALFYVESAGLKGAKALDVLTMAAEGAKVGHADLLATTNALTSVVSSGIKGSENYAAAMGSLNAIVGAGKMHMEDLVGALSTGILPAARTAGISLNQVGAALDTLINSGMNADEASSRLRMTLQMMINPSSEAQKALAQLGLSQKQLFNDMQSGGIQKILQDFNTALNQTSGVSEVVATKHKLTAAATTTLKDAIAVATDNIKKMSDAHVKGADNIQLHNDRLKQANDHLQAMKDKLSGAQGQLVQVGGAALDASEKAQILGKIFGSRESATFESLLQGSDKFNASLTQISNTSGNFSKAWEKTKEDFNQIMSQIGASINSLFVQFGTLLMPAVSKVADFLAKNLVPAIDITTKFFEQHKTALALLAGVIGGIVIIVLMALGVALIAVAVAAWGAVSAFVAMALPFALIGGAIIALGILIATHMTLIQSVMRAVGTFFAQVWKDITLVLMAFGKWLAETFMALFKGPMDAIKITLIVIKDFFIIYWAAIKYTMQVVVDWLSTTFGPSINTVFLFIQSALKTTANFFTAVWNDIVKFLTGVGTWFVKTFSPFFTESFKFISDELKKLDDFWNKIWNGFISLVESVAGKIIGIVKGMLNAVIGFFNNIINGANKVGSKLPGYTSIPSIPTFQTGGVVPGVIGAPVMILAHGGETITPATSGKTPGTAGVTLNVNVGIYAGTEIEQRNLAKALYGALVRLANSQHTSVADLMGA